MNSIDKILQDADEKGVTKEVIEEYLEMEKKNKQLEEELEEEKKKNNSLKVAQSNSRAEQYRKSNKNLKERNKKLSKSYEIVKRSKTQLAHLSEEQLGVYERLLDDYNSSEIKGIGKFPGNDHPIFNHFYELANQYPNRSFLIITLQDIIEEKKKLIDFEINVQRKNIEILEHCAKLQEEYPDTWEDEVDSKEANLFKITTVDVLEQKIEQLKKDKEEVNEWINIKEKIEYPPFKTKKKIKNNLFNEIIHEFDRLFDFCTHVGGVATYKANIKVPGLTDKHLHSNLALELQKQLGLCSEKYSRNFFYSNGEGRLVPFKEDRDVLNYIQNNTTFIKLGKKNNFLHGNIIDADDLFKKVPKYVSKTQYRNDELVGFNNTFYNINTGEVEKLNPQAPILPLKNTKTELYLQNDKGEDIIIEDNAMKTIFNNCFTEQDKKALLAYIGCCLYDKGYTQRQESLFLLSRGNTGKTTFVRAICEIFYNWESQLVTKLSDERFGFSMFADNDIVIVDEIQSAKKDFAEVLKNISTGSNMAIEKKGVDTINLPAKNVPRIIFIGNEFPKNLYYASAGEGVFRRMLCIIPTQRIQDCGFTWDDLTTQSSKQWLVQQATLEYIKQELNKQDKPIAAVSDAEKEARLEMCTYPEHHFIKKHFEMAYLDDGSWDTAERLYYEDFHSFIIEQINNRLLEKTIKEGNSQTFIKTVKECFDLVDKNYHTDSDDKGIFFMGIVPKSNEAIARFSAQESS